MRRLLASLGATALLTGAGLALSPPAQAAACAGTSGVTVVVQSGSSADVRCVPGDPSSAGAALQSAGFSVTQVQTQPGAICTINGAPSVSCVRMPPTSQYWSVHHAPAGGSWTYSSKGAFAYDPAPGTVVGFRLGSGQAPSIAPPKVAAPAPKPTAQATPRPTSDPAPRPTSAPRPSASAASTGRPGTSTQPSAGAGASSTPGGTAPDGSPATSSSAAQPRGSASKSASSTSAAQDTAKDATARKKEQDTKDTKDTKSAEPTSSTTSTPTTAGSDDTTASATGAESDSGSGALVPTAIGGGLLVVLGGGALVMARRREN